MAPPLGSPEPSFFERLAQRLAPDANIPEAYRLALGIAAATGAGLFLPMGFEYATNRRFDPVRATPEDMEAARRDKLADLSGDIAEAIRQNAELPRLDSLRPLTSPAAPVIALLRTDALVLINPDVIHKAPLEFPLAPLPSTSGAALSAAADLDTPLQPGEVRILPCQQTSEVPGGALELSRPWAATTRIAVEALQPGGDYPVKTVVGRDVIVSADIVGDGHDVLAADLLFQPADTAGLAAHPDATARQRPLGDAVPPRPHRPVQVRRRRLVGSVGHVHP